MSGAANVCGQKFVHWLTNCTWRGSNLRFHSNGILAARKISVANCLDMYFLNQSDVVSSAGDITSKVPLITSSEVAGLTDDILTTENREGITSWSLPHGDYTFHGLYLHPHWLRHRELIEAAPQGFLFAIGVYMTVICFAGIIGNLTVIAVFLRCVICCYRASLEKT